MSRSEDTALLSVRDLSVAFREDSGLSQAVSGLSLSVRQGEVVGLVGESGSGKSVTSLALMGLLPTPPALLTSGVISFDGTTVFNAAYGDTRPLAALRGRRMAMIFQDPMTSLNPYLRVGRQLTEVLRHHRHLGAREARKRAISMLERVGLADAERRARAYPHELSGGMRQRVMIAMALLCEAELLIADEPTTALDVTVQAQVLQLIRDLQAEHGMAVLLITHDLGVVAGMADRVAVMYGGRIVEEGACEALFAAPSHPYTQGLLHSLPPMDASADTPLSGIPGTPPDPRRMPAGCAFHPRCDMAGPRCRGAYPRETVAHGDGFARCFTLSPEGTG